MAATHSIEELPKLNKRGFLFIKMITVRKKKLGLQEKTPLMDAG